ncbi:hypothetical protein M514_06878 [Trichuris suis]|uniref:Uncharacterized protein n=1 Tax=Trichuris suis TaxID=68888 RepID=A0A085NBC0_9BILA|nr:hypothetical protein M513_06878 [Trichuris suis]KFD66766.1 hypothetical protein M514_06878 [Trichuris suis]
MEQSVPLLTIDCYRQAFVSCQSSAPRQLVIGDTVPSPDNVPRLLFMEKENQKAEGSEKKKKERDSQSEKAATRNKKN